MSRTNLKDAIIGVWKLKSREDVDAMGKVHVDPFLGIDPIGVLCFGETYFSAQFMKRDRSGQENVMQRAQAKNNSAGVNGYDAYFGTYTIDEAASTLTTTIEGSISPANIEAVYVRDIRIVDDELFVQLQTTTLDGTPVSRTNTFVRDK